jgi:hypothetical protein
MSMTALSRQSPPQCPNKSQKTAGAASIPLEFALIICPNATDILGVYA